MAKLVNRFVSQTQAQRSKGVRGCSGPLDRSPALSRSCSRPLTQSLLTRSRLSLILSLERASRERAHTERERGDRSYAHTRRKRRSAFTRRVCVCGMHACTYVRTRYVQVKVCTQVYTHLCVYGVHSLTHVHAPVDTCMNAIRTQERVCSLLVLNLVSSTLPCIRQPGPRLRVLGVCDFV